MTLKKECDRCHYQTVVGSINDHDFRSVIIGLGHVNQDLCGKCVEALTRWLTKIP